MGREGYGGSTIYVLFLLAVILVSATALGAAEIDEDDLPETLPSSNDIQHSSAQEESTAEDRRMLGTQWGRRLLEGDAERRAEEQLLSEELPEALPSSDNIQHSSAQEESTGEDRRMLGTQWGRRLLEGDAERRAEEQLLSDDLPETLPSSDNIQHSSAQESTAEDRRMLGTQWGRRLLEGDAERRSEEQLLSDDLPETLPSSDNIQHSSAQEESTAEDRRMLGTQWGRRLLEGDAERGAEEQRLSNGVDFPETLESSDDSQVHEEMAAQEDRRMLPSGLLRRLLQEESEAGAEEQLLSNDVQDVLPSSGDLQYAVGQEEVMAEEDRNRVLGSKWGRRLLHDEAQVSAEEELLLDDSPENTASSDGMERSEEQKEMAVGDHRMLSSKWGRRLLKEQVKFGSDMSNDRDVEALPSASTRSYSWSMGELPLKFRRMLGKYWAGAP